MDKSEDANLQLFHRLRALSMELEMARAEFGRLHRLHPTDLRALIQLLDAQRAGTVSTPGWLGGQLTLNSAGTTTLIDRLERLRLVQRTHDTRDRRRVVLEVTASANELGWDFFGTQIQGMTDAMTRFSKAELTTVRTFLDAMIDIAAEHRQGPKGCVGSPSATKVRRKRPKPSEPTRPGRPSRPRADP